MDVEQFVNDAHRVISAWDGRDITFDTDWLDDESFVVNFRFDRNPFPTRKEALEYALPALFAIGTVVERELNANRDASDGRKWVLYSEENYFKDFASENELGHEFSEEDDWDTVQVVLYLDEQ